MTHTIKINISLLGLLLLFIGACEKDYSYTLPPKATPKTAQATSNLEAYFAATAPSTINAAYWKTANYLEVNAKDVSTHLSYGDGAMNLTKTFNGLTNFSKGGNPNLTLKAAYDADYLYILAEWYDSTVNPSQFSWLFNGNADPLKPGESTTGWTSQRNSDKMALAFEINSASSPNGTFANVGCQASCHGTGNTTSMTPSTGSVDIWNWSLATSSPLGYMHDMNATSTACTFDLGGSMATRNASGNTHRSGPAYEWDGTPQTLTLPSGTSTLLDPSFFLLNKTPMIGDANNGATLYASNCESCHGYNGRGGEAQGVNSIGENKKSRSAYKDAMDNVSDMSGYWGVLNEQQKDDIVTFLRGLSGSPGYYLTAPATGTSAADITIVSNVTPIQISNALFNSTNKHQKYQVLIKRKLKTTHTDDVQFDLGTNKSYIFGIALMDEDGINHIGSAKETLIFK